MSSEDVSMGANKAGSRYVRVSDEGGENEYFHLKSDNKRLLGTVSPCKEEKGCLTIMRYILEKMDDAMEKAAKGKKFPKHSVRQLQIVLGSLKGAAYASHNDGSPTLCNNVARHDSSPVVEPAAKRRATKRTVHPQSERRSSRGKMASTAVDTLPASQVHAPASMEENKDEKEDQQDEEQEDGDPDLEEAPDIPCLQTLLPSRYELRVPTITLANVGPGHTVAYFMITDPDDNPVTLFKYNPQTKKWVRQRKSSIPMSGNFIHLQCLQAQLRLKHNVVVALRGMAGLLRLVLSGRNPYHSALPHFKQLMRTANLLEAYEQRHRCYNFINVCSSLARNRRPDMVGCGVDVQKYDQPDRIFPTTKSLATFRTPKGMLPHDIVRYFMPVPIGYIQSNLPLDEVLLSGAFAKVFLKEGIQVTVKSSPDEKKQWTAHHGRMPYVDRIYKVGDKDGKYTSGVLATGDIFPVQDGLRAVNFDGNDKHRKHTWFTVHHSGITYIFCRQMYKCDYISADKLQELMKNGDEIPEGYEFYVDASGGSASINGSVVVATENLPTGCWNIASGVLAQPQEFGTHYNQALLKLIKREGLVVLACPARIMDMPWLDQKEILACGDSIHSDQYLQCFGMLQVTKGGYAEREPVYRTADLPRMSEDGQRTLITPSQMPYLTYRTETHIRLYLKRYDWCQPKPQSSTAPTSENRTITLEMKKGKSGWEVERCGNGRPRLGFLLDDKGEGEGELKTVDALTPGPMYQGMEELAKAFVKDGHITEYLSLEEDPASSQDSGGESDNRALRSGRKLSIARDLIYFYMHLSVAIAARALRMNVHGGKDVSILHQDMFVDSIGDVLRASPSPSFCRIADATTGLYLKMVENSLPRSHKPIMKPGWKRIDPNNGPLPPSAIDWMLVTAVLLRSTGRPEKWVDFFRQVMKEEQPRIFKSRSEIEKFACFLCGICGTHWETSLKGVVSEQMAGSVPKNGTSTPRNFLQYALGLVNELVDKQFYSKYGVHANAKNPEQRKDAQTRLCEIIEVAESSNTRDIDQKKTMFLAGVAMADLDEPLVDPFGEVKWVCLGPGGMAGTKVIVHDNDDSTEDAEQKLLAEQVEEMQKITDEEVLAVIGLKRIETSDGVWVNVWKVNHRPYNLIDAEHGDCKVSILLAYARGTRAYNAHMTYRAHLHPLFEAGLHPSGLDEMYNETISVFQDMRKGGRFPEMPFMFQLLHERLGGDDALSTLPLDGRRSVVNRLLCEQSLVCSSTTEQVGQTGCELTTYNSTNMSTTIARLTSLFGRSFVVCSPFYEPSVNLVQTVLGGSIIRVDQTADGTSWTQICAQFRREMKPEGDMTSCVSSSPGGKRIHYATIRGPKQKRTRKMKFWNEAEVAEYTGAQELIGKVRSGTNLLWRRQRIEYAEATQEQVEEDHQTEEQEEEDGSVFEMEDSGEEADYEDEASVEEEDQDHDAIAWKLSTVHIHSAIEESGSRQHYEPQWAHVDYDNAKIQDSVRCFEGRKPLTCHIPINEAGMMLYVWPTKEDGTLDSGYLLYIPFGAGLLLPGDLYHGGGFVFGNFKNERLHCYIVPVREGTATRLDEGVEDKIHPYPKFDPRLSFDELQLRRLKYYLLAGYLPTDKNSLDTLDVFEDTDKGSTVSDPRSITTASRKREASPNQGTGGDSRSPKRSRPVSSS
jgi:hypothetical protein